MQIYLILIHIHRIIKEQITLVSTPFTMTIYYIVRINIVNIESYLIFFNVVGYRK